jgi:hypothetical protein
MPMAGLLSAKRAAPRAVGVRSSTSLISVDTAPALAYRYLNHSATAP